MGHDMTIAYVHEENGRIDEEFTDVESFDCVNQSDGEHKVLIVRDSSGPPHTTREPVRSLIGVQ